MPDFLVFDLRNFYFYSLSSFLFRKVNQGPPKYFDRRFILGMIVAMVIVSVMRGPVTTLQKASGPEYKTTFVVSTERAGQKVILKRMTKEGVIDEYFVPLESVTDEKGEARFADLFVPSTWEITAGEGRMRKTINYTIQIKEPVHTLKLSLH